MRYLLYFVALTSAFFSFANDDIAVESLGLKHSDLVKGEPETVELGVCNFIQGNSVIESHQDETVDTCQSISSALIAEIDEGTSIGQDYYLDSNLTEVECDLSSASSNHFEYQCKQNKRYHNPVTTLPAYEYKTKWTIRKFRLNELRTINNFSCPPESNPSHSNGPINKDNESSTPSWCYGASFNDDNFECPPGYHTKSTSKQLGSDSCVPNTCPAAGSDNQIYTSKSSGGDPFGFTVDGKFTPRTGLYCNNGCAYDVNNPENVSSSSSTWAISLNQACGTKPYEDGFLTPSENKQDCTTATDSNGVTLLACPTPQTDIEDTPDSPISNEDSKQDETPRPDQPKETCDPTDAACETRNLEAELSNQVSDLIENDNQAHNKLVDTLTNNANIIKDSQINTAKSVEDVTATLNVIDTQQTTRDNVQNELLAQIRDSINNLGTGSTGGGGSDGDGDGEDGTEEPQYNGECEGELCDLDVVSQLDDIDQALKEAFETPEPVPSEVSSYFSRYTGFVQQNFASFTGTCTPFTLDVSIAGDAHQIEVKQHCAPYESYIKPIIEWVLWTLTCIALLNISGQSMRSFSNV